MPGTLTRATLVIPALLVVCVAARVTSAPAGFAGFPASIKSYMELRDRVRSRMPGVSNKADAARIARFRSDLAQALRAARPSARQGDIFTPAAAADFRQVIRTQTLESTSARKSIREGNPATEGNPAEITLEVNAQYPLDQPVSLVPPSILLRLPELPKELKYCFVGTNLVLLDAESNLIIDYLPRAAL